jgi:hypothetical protein
MPTSRISDRGVEADVLIGYEMNGSALPAEHGFPARLVVPGFYGTNSVKWLSRMTLSALVAEDLFLRRQLALFKERVSNLGASMPRLG